MQFFWQTALDTQAVRAYVPHMSRICPESSNESMGSLANFEIVNSLMKKVRA